MTHPFVPSLFAPMNDLSTEQLRRLLSIAEQQQKLAREKLRIMGGGLAKPKPKMSAAARKKIAAKVKQRWAEAKAKGRKKL